MTILLDLLDINLNVMSYAVAEIHAQKCITYEG